MDSLTPFVRHELTDRPGPSGAPEAGSSFCSPPLGRTPLQPPAPPDDPGTQLPPPPLPQPEATGVPMTDGTPVACRQKNARYFLAGDVQTSVMAHYADGLFGIRQHTFCGHPAPDEDASGVQELVDWREESPYG